MAKGKNPFSGTVPKHLRRGLSDQLEKWGWTDAVVLSADDTAAILHIMFLTAVLPSDDKDYEAWANGPEGKKYG